MPKKKAPDKFEVIESTVEDLTSVANRMVDIGVYDREEHQAVAVLVNSLSRAMKVLDTDRYRGYLDHLAEEAQAKYEAENDEPEGEPHDYKPGMYL